MGTVHWPFVCVCLGGRGHSQSWGGLDPFLLATGWGPRSQAELHCHVGSKGGCGGRFSPDVGPSKGEKGGEGASGTLLLGLKATWSPRY